MPERLSGSTPSKVTVEVNITGGGLGLYLVGLPDNAVKESEQRIRSAFDNIGERMSGRKTVVSRLRPISARRARASTCRLPWGSPRGDGAHPGPSGRGDAVCGRTVARRVVEARAACSRIAVCARDAGLRRLVVPGGQCGRGGCRRGDRGPRCRVARAVARGVARRDDARGGTSRRGGFVRCGSGALCRGLCRRQRADVRETGPWRLRRPAGTTSL